MYKFNFSLDSLNQYKYKNLMTFKNKSNFFFLDADKYFVNEIINESSIINFSKVKKKLKLYRKLNFYRYNNYINYKYMNKLSNFSTKILNTFNKKFKLNKIKKKIKKKYINSFIKVKKTYKLVKKKITFEFKLNTNNNIFYKKYLIKQYKKYKFYIRKKVLKKKPKILFLNKYRINYSFLFSKYTSKFFKVYYNVTKKIYSSFISSRNFKFLHFNKNLYNRFTFNYKRQLPKEGKKKLKNINKIKNKINLFLNLNNLNNLNKSTSIFYFTEKINKKTQKNKLRKSL
jgi:hypothetical protein